MGEYYAQPTVPEDDLYEGYNNFSAAPAGPPPGTGMGGGGRPPGTASMRRRARVARRRAAGDAVGQAGGGRGEPADDGGARGGVHGGGRQGRRHRRRLQPDGRPEPRAGAAAREARRQLAGGHGARDGARGERADRGERRARRRRAPPGRAREGEGGGEGGAEAVQAPRAERARRRDQHRPDVLRLLQPREHVPPRRDVHGRAEHVHADRQEQAVRAVRPPPRQHGEHLLRAEEVHHGDQNVPDGARPDPQLEPRHPLQDHAQHRQRLRPPRPVPGRDRRVRADHLRGGRPTCRPASTSSSATSRWATRSVCAAASRG